MRKDSVLSPSQSAAFNMGRVLIEIDTWHQLHKVPVELERAIIIDFAVQHPRTVVSLVPDIKLVLEANQLDKSDFGDLFAHRHFRAIHERYVFTLHCLSGRGLVEQTQVGESLVLSITATGTASLNYLSSAYSLMLRELSTVFCLNWKRKPVSDLVADIKSVIPLDIESLIALGEPFGGWMSNDAK